MARTVNDAIAVLLGRLALDYCPNGCGTITARSRNGHPTLCELCTVREIGLTVLENGARISAGLTVKQMLARDVDAPLPLARRSAFRRRVQG